MKGLYIHIPFCLGKCPYCDFYSVRYTHSLGEDYTAAVVRNLSRYSKETFDTIYFGGGTPILLASFLGEILQAVSIASGAEITAECNPCSASKEALSLLKASGINRLSFGVQSMDDRELLSLGRRHNSSQAENALQMSRDMGFDNISADIMLDIPGQSIQSLTETIERLSVLPVDHVSAYLLKIEPETPFGRNPPKVPDEDEGAELYLTAVKLLEEHGFYQYEISNFAKKGYQCLHNLKYWKSCEYVGIGPAAHSYYKGKRFGVPRDLEGFLKRQVQEEIPEEGEFGTPEEYIMLKLRLSEGLKYQELLKFGDPLEKKNKIIGQLKLIPDRLIKADREGISLTPDGFLVSNEIISILLSSLEGWGKIS